VKKPGILASGVKKLPKILRKSGLVLNVEILVHKLCNFNKNSLIFTSGKSWY